MSGSNERRTRSGRRRPSDASAYQPYEEDGEEGEGLLEESEPEEVEAETATQDVRDLERRIAKMARDQARLERQLKTRVRESPISDATDVLERLADTMGRINPQTIVPNNPGPYEGGQEFLRWKKYVMRCARANRWSTEELTDRMAQFLDGPAWVTFEQLREDDALPADIERLLDAIGNVHCDVRGALRDARQRFRTRRQRPSESVHQFLAVFEALANESQATESSKVQTFIDNVCSEIGEALMRKGVENWAETRAAAVLEQRIRNSRKDKPAQVAHLRMDEDDDEGYETALAAVNAIQDRQAWYQRGQGFNGYRGQDTRRPQEMGARNEIGGLGERIEALTRAVETLVARQGVPNPQPRPWEGRGAPRRCYLCGEPGHIARECPKGNAQGARDAAPAQAPQP
jgi:hypothetical protein